MPRGRSSQGTGDGGVAGAHGVCAYCGYDLRGHAGAAVRCPECGRENRRSATQRVIEVRLRRLHRLDVTLTSFVAAVAAAGVLACVYLHHVLCAAVFAPLVLALLGILAPSGPRD